MRGPDYFDKPFRAGESGATCRGSGEVAAARPLTGTAGPGLWLLLAFSTSQDGGGLARDAAPPTAQSRLAIHSGDGPPIVVCAKFSKSVMGGGPAELIIRSKLASLCSIGQDHPFGPTCRLAERRAQRQSRMPPPWRRHRRSRRAASPAFARAGS